MYSSEELFTLVTQENTLKQRETITNKTEIEINDIHNEDIKEITITLPPYFKVDPKFEALPEGY